MLVFYKIWLKTTWETWYIAYMLDFFSTQSNRRRQPWGGERYWTSSACFQANWLPPSCHRHVKNTGSWLALGPGNMPVWRRVSKKIPLLTQLPTLWVKLSLSCSKIYTFWQICRKKARLRTTRLTVASPQLASSTSFANNTWLIWMSENICSR